MNGIIESIQHVNGKLEVIRREKSNSMYACNPPRPAPDRVFKDIYGIKEGNIILLETIEGEHKPGEYIPESIFFKK